MMLGSLKNHYKFNYMHHIHDYNHVIEPNDRQLVKVINLFVPHLKPWECGFRIINFIVN
jgi:hypothetical protein